MMISTIRRRLLRTDSGFAMLSVLMFLLIITSLGTGLMYLSLNALPAARHEQDYQSALAAAEAGVDDYLARLAQDYNYATNPPDGNAALTSNPAQCVPVGSTASGCYEYSVNTSGLASTGTIYLFSTGIVGKVSRTVKIGLRPVGFLDALSTSDYNLVDPALDPLPTYGNDPATATTYCVHHAYDVWKTPSGTQLTGPQMPGCGGLLNYWVTGNTFNGPMQSNDDYYIYGSPIFNDSITSGDPRSSGPYWSDPAGGSGDSPKFNYNKGSASNGTIIGNRQVTFPPAVSTVLRSQVTVGAPGKGCLYTGPTSIQLNGTTMTVVSPDTKSTNANCVGTNVPLPANGVIYVQNLPASSSDPNYTAAPWSGCPSWTGDGCSVGDAFVQGTLAGQLTIGTDNNVIITGNVTYDSTTATAPRRVLGLIAQNTIEINHTTLPTSNSACTGHASYQSRCNQYGNLSFGAGGVTYTVPVVNPTINAAMLALAHSFSVMDFTEGTTSDLGNVNVMGTIGGKFMDIEGSFDSTTGLQTTGYGVSYSYDSRLRNGALTPPSFLNPVQSYWHRVSYAECTSKGSTNCT